MKTSNFFQLFSLAFIAFYLLACNGESPTDSNTNVAPIASTGIPAIDALNKKAEETPNNPTLYATRAAAWYAHEGYDEAIIDIQKAISLDSLNPEYYHMLADYYLDYRKSRQALKTMETAGSLFPKRIGTLLKLAEFQLILKQHNEALFTLERIKVIDPQHAEMFFMVGNVMKDKQDADRAILAYQSAVENDPDLIDGWINLGQLWAAKNAAIASKFFDNALRVDSNNIEALHAKAYYLGNQKDDLDGAIRLYKKINTLNPQYEDGYYNLGLLYLDQEAWEKARESFDFTIKVAPTFTSAYFYRGVAFQQLGALDKAKMDYEQALKLEPEYERAQGALEELRKLMEEG